MDIEIFDTTFALSEMNNWRFLIEVIAFGTIKLYTDIKDKFGEKFNNLNFCYLSSLSALLNNCIKYSEILKCLIFRKYKSLPSLFGFRRYTS